MAEHNSGAPLPISESVTDSDRLPEISLNDLPRWSPWPSRLLSLAEWDRANRDLEKVEREYNRDKYGACIRFLDEQNGPLTIDTLKGFELGGEPQSAIACSIWDRLFRTTIADARERYYTLVIGLVSALSRHSATVVELGAGYGYNLVLLKRAMPEKAYVGAEYAENAILVGDRLGEVQAAHGAAVDLQGIELRRFNFYDDADYSFLSDCPGPVTVFTVHAVQQIVPTALPMIEALRKHKDKVQRVIHLETVNELHRDDLLGLMRKRYLVENDYNLDVLDCLRAQHDINVVSTSANVFGINPLNPTSVVVWEWK